MENLFALSTLVAVAVYMSVNCVALVLGEVRYDQGR